MKNKEKKKGKNKKEEKLLKKGKNKIEKKLKKGAKPGKLKESTKALRKEIQRLTQELQARDDQLHQLLEGEQDIVPAVTGIDDLSQSLHESSNTGSISERKKIWERHQYLRSCYEQHLEAGLAKQAARLNADKDLRLRYGASAGFTEEQLDSILT
ncbi:MAG: hypothetical protein KDI43_02905 [Gammaproteobacteria bacterium]|nr:hypothetical protein [Gammaproteobacteria bacterium]MCP5406516.1 hypothetical protein [Chromatiaceae bacterium]MCP5444245.1 hypothetical protein [Chromatiaceae bacterium]